MTNERFWKEKIADKIEQGREWKRVEENDGVHHVFHLLNRLKIKFYVGKAKNNLFFF